MKLNNHQKRWSDGFTLIELLVVVFIVGLVSGFAVLSIGSLDDERDIEEQARRLQYQLIMAGEESIIQGHPIGVQFKQGKYTFLIAGRTEWLEINDNKALSSQELLRDWRFELLLGGKGIPLVKEGVDASKEKLSPHIIFYSSGEIDPFELLIEDSENTPKYRIMYGDEGVIALIVAKEV